MANIWTQALGALDLRCRPAAPTAGKPLIALQATELIRPARWQNEVLKELARNFLSGMTLRLSVAIASLFALPCSFRAQDAPELAKIISDCRQTFREIAYVSYTIEATPQGWAEPKLKLIWEEEGEKCLYEYFEWKRDRNINFTSAYSFDGERSFRTFYGSGIYLAKKGAWAFPSWIDNFEFITSPFEFAIRAIGNDASVTPPVKLLQSEDIWSRLIKHSKALGIEAFKGRECFVVQVDDCAYKFSPDKKTYYRVFFSKEEHTGIFSPIAWQQFMADGRLISDLEVTKSLKLKGALSVPEEIRVTYYDAENKDSAPPSVTNSWLYKFSSIQTENISDNEFALDPVNARVINDEDNEVWMTIPK